MGRTGDCLEPCPFISHRRSVGAKIRRAARGAGDMADWLAPPIHVNKNEPRLTVDCRSRFAAEVRPTFVGSGAVAMGTRAAGETKVEAKGKGVQKWW